MGPSVFLWRADGDVGNFLSCLNGVKKTFGAQVGRWDFSQEASVENSLNSRGEENLLVFLGLRRGSSGGMTGNLETRLWGLREVQSPCDSKRATRDSSAVAARAEVLISS